MWIKIGSSWVWYGGGQPYSHSGFEDTSVVGVGVRLAVSASQIIKVMIIAPAIEIKEPTEEAAFHNV